MEASSWVLRRQDSRLWPKAEASPSLSPLGSKFALRVKSLGVLVSSPRDGLCPRVFLPPWNGSRG